MTLTKTLSEAGLRAKAKRRGLILKKCRIRTWEVPHAGTYGLVDARTNTFELADPENGFGYSLEDIAEHLSTYPI